MTWWHLVAPHRSILEVAVASLTKLRKLRERQNWFPGLFPKAPFYFLLSATSSFIILNPFHSDCIKRAPVCLAMLNSKKQDILSKPSSCQCLGLERICPGRAGLSARLSRCCVLMVWSEECQQGCHIPKIYFLLMPKIPPLMIQTC